jgi:hypothetical protein
VQAFKQQVAGLDDTEMYPGCLRRPGNASRAFFDFLANFFGGIVDIQPGDFAARGHQREDAPVIQAEDALHHVLLCFVEDARLGALVDQHLDFFFCNGRLKCWV